jgi:DNA polymerase-3 subunit delta
VLDKFLKKQSGFFLINTKEDEDPLKWFKSYITRSKISLKFKAFDPEFLYENLGAFSFLDDDKILVCKEAEKLKKSDIEYALSSVKPVLFLASSLRSTNALYKFLESQKSILDLCQETKAQREKRKVEDIIDWANHYDKKMTTQTALFLMSIVLDDQDLIEQEILKLSCFVGNRDEITMKDIFHLTSNTKEETLFRLTDALFSKQTDQALKIARSLLHENASLFPLLRGLRTQIQVEMQVASLMLTSRNPQTEIQNLFPYMKGKILEIHMHTAQKFGFKALKKALLAVDEIDFLAKNGVEDEELLLDILISKVNYV